MTPIAVLCADGIPPDYEPDSRTEEIVLVPSLCTSPGQLDRLLGDATAAVIGTCPGEHDSRAIRAIARRAGLDALGVELLDLSQAGDAPRLEVLLAGAWARAGAYTGSRPEQVKPVLRPVLNRRALLRLPLPDYVAVPGIDPAACAASSGCQVCVDTCPDDAIGWTGGKVTLDADRCDPCGRCVTACPTGAITTPTCTPVQVEAQVRALLAGQDDRSRGIVFTCSGATVSETDPDWFPVVLPCTAMASLQWLLSPLLLGAGSVAVRRCSDVGCPLGNDDVVDGRIDLARQLLEATGDDAERVGTTTQAPPLDRRAAVDVLDPFAPAGAATGLRALVGDRPDAPSVHLEHRAAPFGLVTVDPLACTVCGACAAGCPTGALSITHDDGEVVLAFDAADCNACGLCLDRCPELATGAIACDRVIDIDALRRGRHDLVGDTTRRCEQCGDTIAADRLLARLLGVLGAEHQAALAVATRYCQRCRGAPGRSPVLAGADATPEPAREGRR